MNNLPKDKEACLLTTRTRNKIKANNPSTMYILWKAPEEAATTVRGGTALRKVGIRIKRRDAVIAIVDQQEFIVGCTNEGFDTIRLCEYVTGTHRATFHAYPLV